MKYLLMLAIIVTLTGCNNPYKNLSERITVLEKNQESLQHRVFVNEGKVAELKESQTQLAKSIKAIK